MMLKMMLKMSLSSLSESPMSDASPVALTTPVMYDKTHLLSNTRECLGGRKLLVFS